MGFVSLYYFAFLIILFPLYFLFPKKKRWVILLVFSLVFFALCSWKSIFFITFATIAVYLASLGIVNNKKKEKNYLEENKELTLDDKKAYKKKNKKIRKTYLTLGILSIVLVLVVMKYLNFLIGNLNSIIHWFNSGISVKTVSWILPLGISFYTFQAIGYLADVYWGKYEAEHNFFKFLLFMSFFPKIMQGPIIRYNEIAPSLFEGNDFDYNNFTNGLKRMLWGYFKKMVIADCIIVFTSFAFGNPSELHGFETIIAIILYFSYDYCDFSGYMDIACGTSLCLGVKLPENFNHPYFAKGIDEYWRRWHMTLGTWFKDYIFYPLSISKFSMALGKKSKKIFKKNANKVPAVFGLIVVWFLTGLWHGASWNYILWGLYFGLIIILGIVFEPLVNLIYKKLKINKNSIFVNIFRHIRTLLLLAFGKVLFETNSIAGAFNFISRMFDGSNYFALTNIINQIGYASLYVVILGSVIVLVVDLIQEVFNKTTMLQKFNKLHLSLQWVILIVLVVMVVWFGYYGSGLPKFEFGYMRF